jgi:3-oxoacyl-[acyl-carrier protein] reductase
MCRAGVAVAARAEIIMSERKVILVTGASRGIGRALAVAAGSSGYDTVINYRSSETEATKTVKIIQAAGGRALSLRGDVSERGDVTRVIKGVVRAFGRLDAVVNNAGIGEVIRREDLDQATFERAIRYNLLSAFLVSQAAIPHLQERGGRLIFLSSGAARTGGSISAAYAASKAGVEGLMHYYATNLRSDRITANAIAPSFVESDMINQLNLPDAATLPLGRLGRPDEMWPALRMILETEYLTGQTIHIDAGRYMT